MAENCTQDETVCGCLALECILNAIPCQRRKGLLKCICVEGTRGALVSSLCSSTLTVQLEVPVSLALMEPCSLVVPRC